MPSNHVDGTELPWRCARGLHEEKKTKSFRQDPYVLAYRYGDYMEKHPMRQSRNDEQRLNQYYQNLLANQPEPDLDATDDRSRAIRYAKEHFECYYEVRDIARILVWLNEAEEKQAPVNVTTLLA